MLPACEAVLETVSSAPCARAPGPASLPARSPVPGPDPVCVHAQAFKGREDTLDSIDQANAKRSIVHPQERIAPHWSRARFVAHGMPEV